MLGAMCQYEQARRLLDREDRRQMKPSLGDVEQACCARRCFELFVGDFVLFAGDWRGGCASTAFFDELERQFEKIAATRLPTWFVDDALRVWRRR